MSVLVPATARGAAILRLAEGGMGYIELIARQEGRFSRLFARKRLHPHFRNDAALRAMFLDEARLAGLIRHPNVTAVLEVGEDEQGPYLLMEYVEGPTVAQILERIEPKVRLLPIALCISVVAQAARGLHAAHQLVSADGAPLGLVHRDISPKNILVGYDGLVRVTDFGIAKANDNLEKTRVGVLKGNVGYMAPEYLRFQDLDCRSDLFALGIVLYELLTRERLYGGDDSAAIARRILDEPPLDIFEVRDVPPELAALLFSLLAKDRELRPPSALAVAGELEAIAANFASVDGPFDMSAFLESELATMRRAQRAAIDNALSPASPAMPSPSGEGPVSRAATIVRAHARGYIAAGIAVAAVLAVPFVLRVRHHARGALTMSGGPSLFGGGWHNCALRNDQLFCWGSNGRGQLGDGTLDNHKTPVPAHIGPVRAAALGEHHTCALLADGTVSCWGRNVRYEIGRPTPPLTKVPMAVEGLAGVTALAAGRQHTCALLTDGTVSCWGANESGQLGRPAAEDGLPPAPVPELGGVTRIFAGGSNTCALLGAGELRCWGANDSGQLGDGARVSRAAPAPVPGVEGVVDLDMGNGARAGSKKLDISKSAGFMCACTRAGTVLCWGNNSTGQLGDGTRDDRATPGPVRGITDAIDVAAGNAHACALHQSGAVSCWGRNEFGVVGDDTMGPATVRTEPALALRITDAIAIALGDAHSCARRRNGEVMCWGVNNFGQLGDDSTTLRPAPHPVSDFP